MINYTSTSNRCRNCREMRNAIVAVSHGPSRNITNLTSFLSFSGHTLNLRLGTSLHATVLKTTVTTDHPDSLVVYNCLISMYSRCNDLSSATELFHHMTNKDTVTYNAMLSAFFRHRGFSSGMKFFNYTRSLDLESCSYDHATLTTILSACGETEGKFSLEMTHSVVLSCGYGVEVSVGNALVTAYFRLGRAAEARKVFEEMIVRNVITWTAVVSGLQQSEFYHESLRIFREMQRHAMPNSLTYSSVLMSCAGAKAVNGGRQVHALVVKDGVGCELCVESTLMDMYSKCGLIDDAFCVFKSIKEPDKVSHTVILVGFAQNGLDERAIRFFLKMVKAGIEIDADIVSAVLGAFGDYAPFALGRQVHSLVTKKRFLSNVFVGNGLVNMYSKCGDLGCSIKVFDEMNERNSVTWNSMIAAFARHGLSCEALQLYENMRLEGVEPTDVTFLSLLHACSHAGDVEKGMEFLRSMSVDYRISPRIEHYACVVDMLGRAARLDDARAFVETLPLEPNALIWQALLGTCGIYGNLELGKYAAQRLVQVAPECPAAYVLLANICSSKGAWKERAEVIKKMKYVGVKKDTGMSWIEINGDVHRFVVGDEVHRQADNIYDVLGELLMHSRDEECVEV